MKKGSLLHNPTAGDNEFSKKELVKLIKEEGFECGYASVKDDGWEKLDEDADFLIIAGGDGTVRRVAKALTKRTLLDKQYPLALLPHGTANNIAAGLRITGEAKDIVPTWHHPKLKPFDLGKVNGLDDGMFFIEALGFGIFPKLMKEMKKIGDDNIGETVDERLHAARCVLLDIVRNYEARECHITADGHEHSGKYLLVEVMNIRSIGPNLILAPNADPGDGCFEVTLIPEDHRNKFESFLLSHINGEKPEYHFTTFTAKRIQISGAFKDLHIDDERIKVDSPDISIELKSGVFEFMLPSDQA